jgi:proline iminopeptidase
VSDLEKLRRACDLKSWAVFGGSWGSTLALAYASKHLNRVAALILRGICLLEPWETDWLYKEGGASRLYPEAFACFSNAAGSKGSKKNLTRSYSRLLKNRQTRKKAAAAWWGWEAKLSQLRPTPDRSTPNQIEELAVLENYYFLHNGWIRPGQLLTAAAKIPSTIPVYIVQGRYDLVCPAASAFSLAKAIKHAKLRLTVAGHAGAEPENAKALREATDILAKETSH